MCVRWVIGIGIMLLFIVIRLVSSYFLKVCWLVKFSMVLLLSSVEIWMWVVYGIVLSSICLFMFRCIMSVVFVGLWILVVLSVNYRYLLCWLVLLICVFCSCVVRFVGLVLWWCIVWGWCIWILVMVWLVMWVCKLCCIILILGSLGI